ncbi:MAG TPA: hypothetical protein VNM43_03590 [Dehalococcoidia bacterium]|nr:hypothetical protein [Dehalococcoidia bacterium]
MLDKIHQDTYWRLVIRPTRFEQRRIASISGCKKIVEETRIVSPGWQYPYWDDRSVMAGNDWVQLVVDFSQRMEFWRFYQSAQFVHHMAAVERFRPARWQPAPPRPIFVEGLIYLMMGLYEFAARMARRGILDPAAYVAVELHNTSQRQLIFWDGWLQAHLGEYVCNVDPISVVEEEIKAPDLVARTTDLAMEAVVRLCESFGWFEPPRQLLSALRDRAVQGRL